MKLKDYLNEEHSKIDSLKEEEVDEANVTGNLDGGSGPVKTPGAFVASEKDMDNDHIEVFNYKRAKKSKRNFGKISELEKQMESQINKIDEISYRDYKRDDSKKDYQKVNDSIKDINRMAFQMERMIDQTLKLKAESSVTTEKYWKRTQERFKKVSERMLRISRKIKELNA